MPLRDEQTVRLAIAGRLREARERAGLSQGQVARLVDMHRPTVTEIEAGNRKVVADELSTFADLYGVSAEWLLGRVGDDQEMFIALAARGLDKLRPEDRERLVAILKSLPRGT